MDTIKFQAKLLETISKPLDKQNVSKDLPRLLKNISVDSSSPWSLLVEKEALFSFLETCSTFIGDVSLDAERFHSLVDLDEPNTLDEYLLESFGESHILITLFKGLTQSIIISVILFTKAVLQLKYNVLFKDAKGSDVWKIDVTRVNDGYRIIHTRLEQVYSVTKGTILELYKFKWRITLCFSNTSLVKAIVDTDCEESSVGLVFSASVDYNDVISKIEIPPPVVISKIEIPPPDVKITSPPLTKRSQSIFFNTSQKKCVVCNETVFKVEQIEMQGKVWHSKCFKCTKCKRTLNLGNFAFHDGSLFCQQHQKELLFKSPVFFKK